jgi:formate--tetrahydrofolate ligase
MKTDIQIAREAKLKPIGEIADTLNIPEQYIEPYGRYMAKVNEALIHDEKVRKSRLILVTSMSPTKSGNGKTTVSVGLALGMNRIGKKAIVALREPSLGPCFGMKGGAAGGGYSQVLPMEKINLHFTGDFHAVTTANNMISALLDNYIYQHQSDGFLLKEVLWKRVLDVNDRSLRHVVTGLGSRTDGITAQTGFDITPASEIMAILCLASSVDDLRRRIDNIILGIRHDGKPFRVSDMGVGGAITVLLLDALHPNLVQTTENTPAFIHGGPFANIAHGCSTVLSTRLAMSLGDYVITEAGFGADLGAEKFFDIKCRKAGLNPALTVLVVTIRGLKLHGYENLGRHIDNIRSYGQSIVIAINRFGDDTDADIQELQSYCKSNNVPCAINNAFAEGGKGAEELATLVVDTIERHPSAPLSFCYEELDTAKDKIAKVCKKIYHAGSVSYSKTAERKLKDIADGVYGYINYPVCIAKTQYSFSTDPNVPGAPEEFNVNISDIVVNAGAEMIVAIAGDIMRMPGLPKSPMAERIDIVDGFIEGLS